MYISQSSFVADQLFGGMGLECCMYNRSILNKNSVSPGTFCRTVLYLATETISHKRYDV